MTHAVEPTSKESGPKSKAVRETLESSGEPLDETSVEYVRPLFAADFSRIPTRSAPSRELSVGSADDPSEHAAEQAADRTASVRHTPSGPPPDFSRVRIHTGPRAAQAAQAINARAFALGPDIVFGAGQYRPHTPAGRRLLVHELAHVVHGTGNTIRRSPAPEEPRMSYSITIPDGVRTRLELIRYAEVKIFGRTTPLEWNPLSADSRTQLNDPSKHVGETLVFRIKPSDLAKYRAVPSGSGTADDRAQGDLGDGERAAIQAEAERRYQVSTDVDPGATPATGGRAELLESFRRDILADRRKLNALPDAVKAILGGPDSFTPAHYQTMIRLAGKLSQLSPAELEDYQAKTTTEATDLAQLERSIDAYLAEKARRDKADEHRAELVQRLYGAKDTKDLYYRYKHLGELGSGPGSEAYTDLDERLDAERAQLAADLKVAGFDSIEDYAHILDAYEEAFLAETVTIALDVILKFEHQVWLAEQQYATDAGVDALLAQVRATSAPALAQRAQGMRTEARLLSLGANEFSDNGAAELADEAGQLDEQADNQVKALKGDPLIADKNFPRAELISGDRAAAKAAISRYLAERRGDIARTRADLAQEPKMLYKLPALIKLSLDQQEVPLDSVQREVIDDRQSAYTRDEMLFSIALGLLGFALTVVSGGVGGLAAAALLTGTGLISTYQAVTEVAEYERVAGFSGVGLADNPSLTWVVVSIVGAGLDVGGAVAAIHAAEPVEKALRLFAGDHDLIALRPKLDALPVKLRDTVLRGAVAEADAHRALLKFGAKISKLHSGLVGLDAIPELALYVYEFGRKGFLGFDRFMQEMRLEKLLDEATLTAEELAELKTAFSEARSVVRDVRTAGKDLGLTENEIGGFIQQMADNPALTVDEVKAAMAETGKTRPAEVKPSAPLEPTAGTGARTRLKKPKAALDVAERQSAATRLERTERDIRLAQIDQVAHENAAVEASRELRRENGLKPSLPPSLKGRIDRVGRLKSVEDQLEAARQLRGEPELAEPEKTYLDWWVRVLQLRQEADLEADAAQALKSQRLSNLTTQREAQVNELRAANKTIIDVMRKEGPNYKAAKRLMVDQVMEEKAWEALPRKSRPELATDHLVSLDRISKLPETDQLLALYHDATPAVKAEIRRELENIGDFQDNLIRMKASANSSKRERSWNAITYQEAKEYGYTASEVDKIREKEAAAFREIVDKLKNMIKHHAPRVGP